MEQMLRVSGKPVTIPTTTRLEAPIYAFAAKQAEAQGVSLATYIKQIILREIGPKLPPPAGTGSAAGG